MKTFYSIVYANIRPSVDERVSIALLLRDEQRIIFHHAPEKLDALRMLMPSEAFSLLRVLVKNLDEYIANPEPVNEHFNYKVAIEPFERRFLDRGYVSYLATYSNNLLTFSEPKAIDLPVTDEAFTQLFKKYIHQDWETARRQATRSQSIERVRRELYPKVKGRVNLDSTITNQILPNLVTPTKVNIAGRNEVSMVAQVIEFDKKQPYSLEADVNRMLALARAFEANGETNGKYFIIGKEPGLALPFQRSIWQNIRQQPTFEFVPDTETARIDEYIVEHNVQPLIPELAVDSEIG
ncbi:hypothetical protein [Spirosoma montaniterrae]|uniref:DUF3037 domain-containing protein n=1 Tax=Spirosoma montaniterrae TaxID=1178516 RepID=A0A1P9X1V1_9BACT|nr:hypothetical protein [Spirosoma montaniterrae]AQG81573.1 hypothetical protein AWR27_21020 [Spirosoma montaniterrae]